jgi:hypothetical protein
MIELHDISVGRGKRTGSSAIGKISYEHGV